MTPERKKEIEKITTFIDLYPTHFNGVHFTLPLGWTSELSKVVGQKIAVLLDEEVKKAERKILENVLKIIDDNDPQTDNKVSPRYWGATLRKDISALKPKEINNG